MSDRFKISFRKQYDPKTYTAFVTITHRNKHTLQVVVKGGSRELYLKKFLFRKTNQWVKVWSNFNMHDTSKPNLIMLESIFNAIDAHLLLMQ